MLSYNDIQLYVELQEEFNRQAKKVFEKMQREIPRWYRDYFYLGLNSISKNQVIIQAKHLLAPETVVTIAMPVEAFVDSSKLEALIATWKSSYEAI